jgi:Ca2+-transporting ATPase
MAGEGMAATAHRATVAEITVALGTDRLHGLSDAEAQLRLEHDGRNELIGEPPTPLWRRFVAQFQDALVILLLVATAISTLL